MLSRLEQIKKKKITLLDLSGTKLDKISLWRIAAALTHNDSINEINLSHTDLNDSLLGLLIEILKSYFEKHDIKIISINLCQNNISDVGVKSLKQIVYLTSVDLSRNTITRASTSDLLSHPGLKNIIISDSFEYCYIHLVIQLKRYLSFNGVNIKGFDPNDIIKQCSRELIGLSQLAWCCTEWGENGYNLRFDKYFNSLKDTAYPFIDKLIELNVSFIYKNSVNEYYFSQPFQSYLAAYSAITYLEHDPNLMHNIFIWLDNMRYTKNNIQTIEFFARFLSIIKLPKSVLESFLLFLTRATMHDFSGTAYIEITTRCMNALRIGNSCIVSLAPLQAWIRLCQTYSKDVYLEMPFLKQCSFITSKIPIPEYKVTPVPRLTVLQNWKLKGPYLDDAYECLAPEEWPESKAMLASDGTTWKDVEVIIKKDDVSILEINKLIEILLTNIINDRFNLHNFYLLYNLFYEFESKPKMQEELFNHLISYASEQFDIFRELSEKARLIINLCRLGPVAATSSFLEKIANFLENVELQDNVDQVSAIASIKELGVKAAIPAITDQLQRIITIGLKKITQIAPWDYSFVRTSIAALETLDYLGSLVNTPSIAQFLIPIGAVDDEAYLRRYSTPMRRSKTLQRVSIEELVKGFLLNEDVNYLAYIILHRAFVERTLLELRGTTIIVQKAEDTEKQLVVDFSAQPDKLSTLLSIFDKQAKEDYSYGFSEKIVASGSKYYPMVSLFKTITHPALASLSSMTAAPTTFAAPC